MANKKINELVTRTPSLSDLILVGDPSSGYSYKATVTALATIIETDIADGFVTISTTQTISGAKTFSNNLTLTSVANAATTQTKFLTLNGSNVVNYRTGAEVLADIGGQGTLTLTTTGTSGAATLVGNTLNIPQYQSTLTNPVTGTGTTNYLPKFTGSTTIGNSQLIDNGTTVFLGTSGTLPNVKMIISTTSQRALELNSTSGNALFVSSGGAFVMTVTNGTWSSQFTQAGRLELGGDLSITTIANATVDTDKFLVSDSGVLKYRTGAEVLSDIGGASSASISGTTNYIPKFTSSSAIGNSAITDNGTTVTVGEQLLVSFANPDVDGIKLNATTGTNAASIMISNTGGNFYIGKDKSDGSRITGTAYANAVWAENIYPIVFGISNTEQMRLTSTGLGIGTSSPAVKLDVAGNTRVGGSGNPSLTISGTDGAYTGLFYINAAGGGASKIFANGGTNTLQLGTNNTERLTLDASGNLGINTSLPAYKLDVNNTGGSIAAARLYGNDQANVRLRLENTGGRTWELTSGLTGANNSTFTIYDVTATATRLQIDASGNLGLSVTPSASTIPTLQFGANAIITSSNTTYLNANATFNSGWKYIASSLPANQYQQSNGEHAWFNAPSGTAGNAISFTQAMTLDASGRLGIGTSSPSSLLHLSTANASNQLLLQSTTGTNAAYMNFKNTGGNNFIGVDNSTGTALFVTGGAAYGFSMVSESAYPLVFGTNNTERMRITSAGNVGIGTTSPGSPLSVKTNESVEGISIWGRSDNIGALRFKSSTGATNYATIYSDATNLYFNNDAAGGNIFSTNNTERMRITSGGEVYIAGTTDQGAYNLQVNGTGVWGAGAYVNGSDIALKQNILPLDNSLELVKKMKPVTYTYKESYSTDDSIQTGFIAQDLQELLKDKNYLNGIVKQGPEYLNVAYQNLIPLLVKAIQEQQIEIENLKNK